jgi:hypothetical protein
LCLSVGFAMSVNDDSSIVLPFRHVDPGLEAIKQLFVRCVELEPFLAPKAAVL